MPSQCYEGHTEYFRLPVPILSQTYTVFVPHKVMQRGNPVEASWMLEGMWGSLCDAIDSFLLFFPKLVFTLSIFKPSLQKNLSPSLPVTSSHMWKSVIGQNHSIHSDSIFHFYPEGKMGSATSQMTLYDKAVLCAIYFKMERMWPIIINGLAKLWVTIIISSSHLPHWSLPYAPVYQNMIPCLDVRRHWNV